MEIYPRIHQFKVPIPGNGLNHLNSYLIKTESGSLLIDTGWNADISFNALSSQLAEAGITYHDLRYVVISHVHPDHYGLIGRLMPLTHAKLVLHELEWQRAQERYINFEQFFITAGNWLQVNGLPLDLIRKMRNITQGTLLKIDPVTPDIIVHGGEHLQIGDFELEVVWTPGHAPGHICLYEHKRRILFSGDQVLFSITPNIGMDTPMNTQPLADYMDSLRQLAELPSEIVFPAHGEIFTDLTGRAGEIIAHHQQRLQATLAALNGQAKTAYQVAELIPWTTNGVGWKDLNLVQMRFIVAETLSHLELLWSQGVLTKREYDGVLWYATAKPVLQDE